MNLWLAVEVGGGNHKGRNQSSKLRIPLQSAVLFFGISKKDDYIYLVA